MFKGAGILAIATVATMMGGCTPKPAAKVAEVKDKLYVVTPDAVSVKAGILVGELTEMKVTERVEDGSGRIATPVRLTGKLDLKNVSSDQTVRLLAGRILYMDMQGKPILLENSRAEPTIKIASGYSAQERLDPGQNATQNVEAEFPVAALEAGKLKDIRLELSYIPSSFKAQTLNFAVSVKQ